MIACVMSLLAAVPGAVPPGIGGLVLDANGEPGRVVIQRPVTLTAGQTLVLAPDKDYQGRPLPAPRPVRVVLDAEKGASLVVEPGARLVAEGTAAQPVEWSTTPADPPTKPVVALRDGANAVLRHVGFVNAAVRVEGAGHSLEHVSVQYAGDQPAFTFAGARGAFSDLYAHHCTWGFSFQPLAARACALSINRSVIRSCARGKAGAFYGAGGALQALPAPGGERHQVRFDGVDWDPSWDALEGIDLQATGSRPRIVAIGDSIVQGSKQYVNFWNYFPGNDDVESSWPYVLQQHLPEYFVINKGEGGDSTAGMLARLSDIIDKIKPRYCVLGGGTNDLGRGQPEQTVARFREMWGRLRAAGIVPVQLAITPYARPDDRETRIIETNRLLREACAAEGVRFVDTYTPLLKPSGSGLSPDYDCGDGLHLNKAAYKKIGVILAEGFRKAE